MVHGDLTRRLRLRGRTFCILVLSLLWSHCLRFCHPRRQSWGLGTGQYIIGRHRGDCGGGGWYWGFGGRGWDVGGRDWEVLGLARNKFVEELGGSLGLVCLSLRTRLFLQSIREGR